MLVSSRRHPFDGDDAGLPLDLRAPVPAHDTGHVGLNPFRQNRRSPADILMVAGALIVCAALVAWALFG
jgi:hypothetical protein